MGFASTYAHLWPFVRAVLKREVEATGGAATPHITFAGHSLGAGVATLLSYAAAEFLREKKLDVPVTAVLFGAPNSE